MKLHPRTDVVTRARLDLTEFFMTWAKKHDLTLAEEAHILSDRLMDITRYIIRYERHGRGDKKGDEA